MNQLATLEQNPLANISAVPQGLSITHDVRMRQAQAEMLSRYHLALMLPRSWVSVNAKLLAACDAPDFAKVAFYSKPAGREKIEGLSIRFAELALQLMRNVSVDTSPEMEDDLSIHYRMTVVDLESNVPMSETFKVEKTVERRSVKDDDTVLSQRTNSSGEKVFLIPATEDQINTKLAAQKSKVRRTLILALVPAEVRAQCLARCKAVAADGDKQDPQAATKGIVSAFLSIGVDVPDLKEYLGHSPASLVAKEIEDLRGIFACVRDGEITWGDVMEAKREREAARPAGSKAAFVEQKQKARAAKKAKNSTPATTTSEQPAARAPRGRAAASAPADTKAPKDETPPATRTRASRRSEEDDASDANDTASSSDAGDSNPEA